MTASVPARNSAHKDNLSPETVPPPGPELLEAIAQLSKRTHGQATWRLGWNTGTHAVLIPRPRDWTKLDPHALSQEPAAAEAVAHALTYGMAPIHTHAMTLRDRLFAAALHDLAGYTHEQITNAFNMADDDSVSRRRIREGRPLLANALNAWPWTHFTDGRLPARPARWWENEDVKRGWADMLTRTPPAFAFHGVPYEVGECDGDVFRLKLAD